MGFKVLVFVVFLVGVAVQADAQAPIKLEFKDGQVTLIAHNAPIRAILTEWARVGGATIVNGDRVPGGPVTLEVTGVSEQQALDIVLRGVAGYMLAPRPTGSQGVSAFNRIVILPASVAPKNPPQTSTPVAAGRRPGMPRPAINPDAPPEAGIELFEPPQEIPVEPVEPTQVVIEPPQRPGGGPRLIRPIGMQRQLPPQVVNPNEPNEETVEPEADTEAAAPTPANPFGVPAGSSATPGPGAPPPPQQRRNITILPTTRPTDREP